MHYLHIRCTFYQNGGNVPSLTAPPLRVKLQPKKVALAESSSITAPPPSSCSVLTSYSSGKSAWLFSNIQSVALSLPGEVRFSSARVVSGSTLGFGSGCYFAVTGGVLFVYGSGTFVAALRARFLKRGTYPARETTTITTRRKQQQQPPPPQQRPPPQTNHDNAK